MVLIIGLRGGKALYRAEKEVTNQDRRLDYLGEAAFVLSMLAYFVLKIWETEK
jgi:hypothetical protein